MNEEFGLDKIRLKELQHKISYYNDQYYNKDISLIPDEIYDKYFKEMKDLELKLGSPSLSELVGSKIKDNKFKKTKHNTKMYSLNNVYNIDELLTFLIGVYDKIDNEDKKEFYIEPKYDGLAISLIYENGILVKAVTRGDGNVGEDVTINVMQIKNIPHTLPINQNIEVRGEVLMSFKSFKECNKIRERNGESLFANPRNAASGTIKLLDENMVKERSLSFVAYDILDARNVEKYSDILVILYAIGFENPSGFRSFNAFKPDILKHTITQLVEEYKINNQRLPYPTDGCVIKLNDLKLREELGYTSRAPKWAIAYKFESEVAVTKLKRVTAQVGRTGIITPVAEFDVVELAGTKVNKATLHNYQYIKEMGLRENDFIEVTKSAEIIPYVMRCREDLRTEYTQSINPPKECPSCLTMLNYSNDDLINIKCKNLLCREQFIQQTLYMVNRDNLNIKGIGPATVEKLIDKKYFDKTKITLPIDVIDCIYTKHVLCAGILGLQNDVVKKIVDNIQHSIDTTPYYKVIASLGIPHVGKSVAILLSTAVPNLYDIKNIKPEDLVKIDGIGEVMANDICNYFKNELLFRTITILDKLGYPVQNNTEDVENTYISGKRFCFTGKLKYPRKHYEDIIIQNGGSIASSIGPSVNYLVLGENAGKKREAAIKNKINIIDEDTFRKIINLD